MQETFAAAGSDRHLRGKKPWHLFRTRSVSWASAHKFGPTAIHPCTGRTSGAVKPVSREMDPASEGPASGPPADSVIAAYSIRGGGRRCEIQTSILHSGVRASRRRGNRLGPSAARRKISPHRRRPRRAWRPGEERDGIGGPAPIHSK